MLWSYSDAFPKNTLLLVVIVDMHALFRFIHYSAAGLSIKENLNSPVAELYCLH